MRQIDAEAQAVATSREMPRPLASSSALSAAMSSALTSG
jgi:hypothetical protein